MCTFNIFVIVRIPHAANHYTAGSSDRVILETNGCFTGKLLIVRVCWWFVPNRIKPNATPPWGVVNGYPLTILRPPLSFFLSFISSFPSIAFMPSNAASSTTDADVSGITESCVPTDQSALVPPIHTAISRRTDLFPSFCRSVKSDVFIFRRESSCLGVSRYHWGAWFWQISLLFWLARDLGALCLSEHCSERIGAPDCCEVPVFHCKTVPFEYWESASC